MVGFTIWIDGFQPTPGIAPGWNGYIMWPGAAVE